MVRAVEKPEIKRQSSGTNPPPFFIWLRHRTKYGYDGSNRRIEKHTYSGGSLAETRHYYYNTQWQCLEERLESGGQLAATADTQYVWGMQYVDNLIFRERDTDADGSLDETLYALQDANWNVTTLVKADGTIAERFIYDAYGEVTELDPDFTSFFGSGYEWEYTYTGRREDAESGLMYYRNRYYDTELGRFINRDPIGYAAGDENLYRYVGGNPVGWVDPDGRVPSWDTFEGLRGMYETGKERKRNDSAIRDQVHRDILKGSGKFGKGVWNGAVGLISGIYNTFRHPQQTKDALSDAVWHYDDTYDAIKDDIIKKSQTSEGQGEIYFDVASSVFGWLKARKLAEAQKVAKAAQRANATKKALEVAESARGVRRCATSCSQKAPKDRLGRLVKIDSPDPAADALAKRLGGSQESSFRMDWTMNLTP